MPIFWGDGCTPTPTALTAQWRVEGGGLFPGHPPALLAPADTGQVQAVLRAATEHRGKLVPQGGNSSMVGGATPPDDGSALILSTRRMNRIRRIDTGAGMVVAEAGGVPGGLHAAGQAVGARVPV